jgi:hypothetical protein
LSLLYARSIRKELSATHQAPHPTNESNEELPWKLLANAIIIKAVEDFENNVISEEVFLRFIKSEYFAILSRGCIPPEKIIKEVVEPCRQRQSAVTRWNRNLTKTL